MVAVHEGVKPKYLPLLTVSRPILLSRFFLCRLVTLRISSEITDLRRPLLWSMASCRLEPCSCELCLACISPVWAASTKHTHDAVQRISGCNTSRPRPGPRGAAHDV